MLKDLLIPACDLEVVKQFSGGKDKLGYRLKQNKFDENNLPKAFILGIPEARTSFCHNFAEAPAAIRKQLYSLTGFEENFTIVDLGDIKSGKDASDTFAAIRMVTEELSQFGLPVLLLGGSQDITVPVLTGQGKTQPQLTIIDDRIDNFSDLVNSNDEIFINNLPFDTTINCLAVQSFFTHQYNKDEVNESFTGQIVTLGELRNDIREAEPYIREADLVSFDYGAMKIAEAPGQVKNSPNGLTGEEACQIAWYTGIATSPVWFALFGYSPQRDPQEWGAMMTAQISWYYLNGINQRIDEPPTDEAIDFIHYQVAIDGLEEPVTFLKHPVSKRWWMEVPSADCDYFPLRVACSKTDYKRACKNDIPERWWHYFNQNY